MSDEVRAPAHYAGDGRVACMDAMASMLEGYEHADGVPMAAAYWAATAVKYLWRWPLKNGRQDLEKAARCVEYALAALGDGGAR